MPQQKSCGGGVALFAVTLFACVLALVVTACPTPALAAQQPTTFKELAAALANAPAGEKTEIVVAGTLADDAGPTALRVNPGAKIVLTGTGVIKGAEKTTLEVPTDATLINESAILDGVQTKVAGRFEMNGGEFRNVHLTMAAPLYVTGSLVVRGGSINNNSVQQTDSTISFVAPVTIDANGSFEMSGGRIENNTASHTNVNRFSWTSGVSITGQSARGTMTGGAITGNTAECSTYGGGVAVGYGGQFNFQGGSIDHNLATFGGGVAVLPSGIFYLDGGTIDSNKTQYFGGNSAARGGGIYTASESTYLKSGSITNNTSEYDGGGIYVEGDNRSFAGVLTAENLLITDNQATMEAMRPERRDSYIANNRDYAPHGGGLMFCDTGTAHMFSANGLALFGNKALDVPSRRAAGDDLSIVKQNSNSQLYNYNITYPEIMLGGGTNKWYRDGSANWWRSLDYSVPRYNKDNPGAPIVDFNSEIKKQGVGAVNLADASAQTLAKRMARVTISGNKAIIGGGIACNGHLITGVDEKPYRVKVYKVWNEGAESQHPSSVEAALVIGGIEVKKFTLADTSNWQADLGLYPDPSTLISTDGTTLDITVQELKTEGYTSEVIKKVDEDNKIIEFTIVNTPIPPTPPEVPPAPPVTPPTPPEEPPSSQESGLPFVGDTSIPLVALLSVGFGLVAFGLRQLLRTV